MDVKNMTHDDLSIEIFKAISHRGYTYNECSEAFNTSFKYDIEERGLKPLNKDLLHRIKVNNYSTSSVRVAKLCEFLKIDAFESKRDKSLAKEAYMVDDLLKSRPDLQPQIRSLINSIVTITKGVSA